MAAGKSCAFTSETSQTLVKLIQHLSKALLASIADYSQSHTFPNNTYTQQL